MSVPAASRDGMSDPNHATFPTTSVGDRVPGAARRDSDSTIDSIQRRLQTLAAAVEIQSELDRADDFDTATVGLATQIAVHLKLDHVWIAWTNQPGSEAFRVVGQSANDDGVTIADLRRSDRGRMLEAVAEEVATRESIANWPAQRTEDRHALLTLRQLASSEAFASVIAVPLTNFDGLVCGVLVASKQDVDSIAQNRSFFHTIGPLVGAKLSALHRCMPSPVERRVRTLIDTFRRSRKTVVVCAIAALLMIMLFPTHYRIHVGLELQPVLRRFVAVGFDGLLKSSSVRPGDQVNEGDLLATIDPREIDYELASVQAELHQAAQERKGLMVEHDFAGSKIAALEVERLQLQKDLLEHKRSHLEVRSPTTGIVVTGDWKESEGMPMTRGETLFEIAPLGKMRVELAVPESDYSLVRREMPVQFYVHSLPNRRFDGSIAMVHPRAELRDQDNVFVAEVMVDDPEHLLRPGMRGRAVILSDRHALGWNLFHKSFFAIRRATGW
ncbi:macrolide transporter subunit MacA [Rubripirellula tenax]|uniref:Macrolide transporter subunit MacA n=1 Tax=Rubripirellula tenax TaxID=2528015 RepID=A0A5C6F5Q4_9BACT|nr:efflux RND transporter periplasmic adaptor subunit [Rubripirellula tenax]TWU56565.1 macrolide transporter subunit MacA [Rubripirellula tenax]